MKRRSYITTICICFCIFFTMTAQPAIAFPDTREHWAQSHIDLLQSRELIAGYPDGSYRPEDPVTRQELVSLLIRILGEGEDAVQLQQGETAYKDTAHAWARGYIEMARELSIVHGDEQGYFYPDVAVTREEAVIMMVNSLGLESITDSVTQFIDDGKISEWARPYVAAALKADLISGFPDGSFRPRHQVTRAEAAVLLENLLGCRGQKYHFFGELLSIDISSKKARVLIAGQVQTFVLSETVSAYRQGDIQPVYELSLPVKAYINVNSAGQLAYLYLVGASPVNKVRLSLTSLPRGISDNNQAASRLVTLEAVDDRAGETIDITSQNLARSLYNTKEAMKVNEFVEKHGTTGQGQLIAVIDSGIDPGHADLQKTSEGLPKILDFVDLTNQGTVKLKEISRDEKGFITIGERRIDVSNLPNNAEKYRYGYFQLPSLPVTFMAGEQAASVLVIVAASKYNEKFDTVYIDTNGDHQFGDEIAVKKYNQLHQFVPIRGTNGKQLNLIVSEISEEGTYVKLSFDSLGHGTQVAGIAAAQGTITGVAPGAQILAIKVSDNMGEAPLACLERALQLAAERGAKTAVISMGQYSLTTAESQRLNALAEEMLAEYGLIICLAAGNKGPGIETAASTAALNNVISVGAYATPAMWKNDYGWSVAQPTLWYFSSAGPASNGKMAPAVIAPGSVVSAYPLWGEQNYRLSEGTSMAAPHVAGIAALLNSALSEKLNRHDTQAVYYAILNGADRLESFCSAEQGRGAVNILNAWEQLQKGEKEMIAYSTSQYSPDYGYVSSFYSRFLPPAELRLRIYNNSDQNYHMAAGGLSSWIKPAQYTIQLPSHGYRNLEISYDQIDEPGLYSDLILLDDIETPGYDISVIQTLVVPVQLQKENGHKYAVDADLPAGQMARYYFYIPEGAEKLSFNLDVGEKGRGRLHVIAPGGDTETSSYAGVGEIQVQPAVSLEFTRPEAGTWEVVVYSSASLSDYKLKTTDYNLTAFMEGFKNPASIPPDNKYLVTAITEKIAIGEESIVTLHFWDPDTKEPAGGVVAIEGRLYEIHNGMVQIPVIPETKQINLNIAW